ncbi:unnamed protein product [Amoebophrya sp. A25]|nr:unnamed protein product [Amoebophrya sp. A25]|eukprot:GSA25T00022327001.1
MRPPSLVVFDLDNCCWDPEMYQMSSGSPFTHDPAENTCKSSRGEIVRLMGDVPHIWGLLRWKGGDFRSYLESFPDSCGKEKKLLGSLGDEVLSLTFTSTKIAIASCCDEPGWAKELLQKFNIGPPSANPRRRETMADAVSYVQIHYGAKTQHFKEIESASKVPLEDMFFFDDQSGHIRNVGKMGVTAVQTPYDGVTWELFLTALQSYNKGR